MEQKDSVWLTLTYKSTRTFLGGPKTGLLSVLFEIVTITNSHSPEILEIQVISGSLPHSAVEQRCRGERKRERLLLQF